MLEALAATVHIPITTAEKVSAIGAECSLYIHSVYREDSATLYGFATREDRDFYRLLIERVPHRSQDWHQYAQPNATEILCSAIASSDVALLSKCPGIGKKTAERLVIEFKDKVGLASTSSAATTGEVSTSAEPSAFQDAVASLMTLGYKPADADKLVRKAVSKLDANAPVDLLLREALS